MNIKNLFLTIGITCSSAAVILTGTTKVTTPVKADSANNTYFSLQEQYNDRINNYVLRKSRYYSENTILTRYEEYERITQDERQVARHVTYILQYEYKNEVLNNNFYFDNRNIELPTQTKSYVINNINYNAFLSNIAQAEDNGDLIYLTATTYNYKTTSTFKVIGEFKPNQITVNEKNVYIYSATYTNYEITNNEDLNKFENSQKLGQTDVFNDEGSYYTWDNIIYIERGEYNVLDIPGFLIKILIMPFTFISQAFNLTLFPNTPYQINFSNLILGMISVLTVLFIIKVFTGGLDVIGNINRSTRSASERHAKKQERKIKKDKKE